MLPPFVECLKQTTDCPYVSRFFPRREQIYPFRIKPPINPGSVAEGINAFPTVNNWGCVGDDDHCPVRVRSIFSGGHGDPPLQLSAAITNLPILSVFAELCSFTARGFRLLKRVCFYSALSLSVLVALLWVLYSSSVNR